MIILLKLIMHASEASAHLKKVTLSKDLRVIGSQAFYNCKTPSTIFIPSNVIDVQKYAFGDVRA